MPDTKLLEYNSLDASCTLEAKNAFWPDLYEGFLPAYDMTINLFPVLTFLQTRGIKVNHEMLGKTLELMIKQIEEKQEQLNRLCGRELNVNSWKDCQKYFYIELGYPPYMKEGKITTDDLAMQRLARGTLARPGLRQARLVQDIRGLQKLRGTYFEIEFDPDDRMRCSYNPRGTKYGRFSSSKTIFGTGTNMQNLPQEFKQFLVPDDGYVFWEIDKRQAEWVVVAYLSADASMLNAIETGKDVHIHTASNIFGIDPELLKIEGKLVGMNTDPEWIAEMRASDPRIAHITNFPRTMSGRQCGKKSNHALNYDEGPNQWALLNEVEISFGKFVHAMYHSGYPGIHIWHASIKRQLQKDRILANCFGRKCRFMGAWDNDLFKSAYSFLPQSTVVDSLNEGMVRIYEDDDITSIQAANLDLLAQVHDSVLMQIPIAVVRNKDRFLELRDRIYDYVSPTLSYNGRQFKIATDSKFGFNWGGYHKSDNPTGMQELVQYSDILAMLDSHNERTTAG